MTNSQQVDIDNKNAAWLALVEASVKADKGRKKAEKALNAAANGDEGAMPYEVALALFTLAKTQHSVALALANTAWARVEDARKGSCLLRKLSTGNSNIFNEQPTAWALYVRRNGGDWSSRPMLYADHADALDAQQRSDGGDHVAELRPLHEPVA